MPRRPKIQIRPQTFNPRTVRQRRPRVDDLVPDMTPAEYIVVRADGNTTTVKGTFITITQNGALAILVGHDIATKAVMVFNPSVWLTVERRELDAIAAPARRPIVDEPQPEDEGEYDGPSENLE